MEAACPSDVSIKFYRVTRCTNLEDRVFCLNISGSVVYHTQEHSKIDRIKCIVKLL